MDHGLISIYGKNHLSYKGALGYAELRSGEAMVKLNKIYTRTGDKGETGLVDGSRLPKNDARFEAMGGVDEANAIIGLARQCRPSMTGPDDEAITRIQNDLFDLGADLATPIGARSDDGALRIAENQIQRLENEIDHMNEVLEPLRSFVLPGGTEAASYLHLARTVVRRAERAAFAASEAVKINPLALQYLNRLSDHLFVMARYLNRNADGDVLWVPGENR